MSSVHLKRERANDCCQKRERDYKSVGFLTAHLLDSTIDGRTARSACGSPGFRAGTSRTPVTRTPRKPRDAWDDSDYGRSGRHHEFRRESGRLDDECRAQGRN